MNHPHTVYPGRLWRCGRSLLRMHLLDGIQYRFAAWAGAATSIFWCLIEITVYRVFFLHADGGGADLRMTLAQTVSYWWIGQWLFLMQPMNIEAGILAKIESGDIGIELCRPFPLYTNWLFRNLSSRLTPLVWRGSVVAIAGLLMPAAYRLAAPASIAGFALFLLSACSACILCTAYANLICAVRLSITWGNGPTYILMLVGGVLSGAYLPLQLWPEALQRFLLWQPFAGYLDVPARLYVGTLAPAQAAGPLALQVFWSVVFIALGRYLMARRLQSIIVQGG